MNEEKNENDKLFHFAKAIITCENCGHVYHSSGKDLQLTHVLIYADFHLNHTSVGYRYSPNINDPKSYYLFHKRCPKCKYIQSWGQDYAVEINRGKFLGVIILLFLLSMFGVFWIIHLIYDQSDVELDLNTLFCVGGVVPLLVLSLIIPLALKKFDKWLAPNKRYPKIERKNIPEFKTCHTDDLYTARAFRDH